MSCREETASRGILYPDERRGRVRAEVCDKCRGYLKVVIRFAPAAPEELALYEVELLAVK